MIGVKGSGAGLEGTVEEGGEIRIDVEIGFGNLFEAVSWLVSHDGRE